MRKMHKRVLAALLAGATAAATVFPGPVFAADSEQPPVQIEQETEAEEKAKEETKAKAEAEAEAKAKAEAEAKAKAEAEEKAKAEAEAKAKAEAEAKAKAAAEAEAKAKAEAEAEKKAAAEEKAKDTADTSNTKDSATPEQPVKGNTGKAAEEKTDTASTKDTVSKPEKTDTAGTADAAKAATDKTAEPETPAEADPEEPVEEDQQEEVKVGRVVFHFDDVNGTVKAVISSDKGADKNDPSITYQKKADGNEKVSYRNGAVEDAVVSEKNGVITVELEVGTKVEVIAEPETGYKVAEYSVTIDDGGREVLPFGGKNSEDHIEWKYKVAEETAVFDLQTKEVPKEEEPEAEPEAAEEAATEATAEEAEENKEEAKTGTVTFDFGNADAEASVTVTGKDDAVLTYNKDAGKEGSIVVSDDVLGVSQDGVNTTVEFEVGTEVKVVAKAKEGFKVSEFTIDGNNEAVSEDGAVEWTYTVTDGSKAFSMKTEAAAEDIAPAATLSVKLDSEGGSVKVMDGDKAVASFEKKDNVVMMTDAEGKTAPAELTDGMAVAAAGDPGKEYTVTAEAEDGYNVTIFTVTDNTGKAKELGFFDKLFKKDTFSTSAALAEGNTTVEVSFTNMPALTAEQQIGDVTVKISADKGVFPEGTIAEVREMTEEEAKAYVESAKAMAEDPEDATPVLTVDVTFKDKDGNEVHPAGMVNVTFENAADEAAIMSVYHAADADAAKTEKLESTTNGKDVVTSSSNFSPLTLLKASNIAMPNPSNDQGTYSGKEPTPDHITAVERRTIKYSSVGYIVNGARRQTEPIVIELPDGRKSTAICCDPLPWGLHLTGKYKHVERTTSANIVKALYYGLPEFGHNYAKSFSADGSDDGGIVLAHMAVSFYALSNGLGHGNSFFEGSGEGSAADVWSGMPDNMKNDLINYMNKIEELPTPGGVSSYIVYPNDGYTYEHPDGEHFIQFYACLVKNVNPAIGMAKVKKASANTTATNGNSNYSLNDAQFGIYDTQANANARGTAGRKTVLTTDANGDSPAYELEEGTYYMAELKAPKGFKLNTEIKSFTVSEDKTTTVSFADQPITGPAKVAKTSANTSITNGNNCYNLAGGQYGIYDTREHALTFGATGRKAVLTTDASGNTSTYSLPLGTYYMAEIKAPTGYLLPASAADRVKEFKITSENTVTVSFSNEPGADPRAVQVEKANVYTDDNPRSLEGTEFEIKYYDGYYNAGNLPGSATRTWVITTKKTAGGKYMADINTNVSGDATYKVGSHNAIPLGTVTITEKKAAPGYVNDGTFGGAKMFIGQVVMNSNGTGVEFKTIQGAAKTMNSSEITFGLTDTPEFGGMKTVKADAETMKPVTERTDDNNTATFEIISENDYSVTNKADTTKVYKKGDVVGTYVTGKNGVLNIPADTLQTGTYTLRETQAPEGYLLNTKTYTFEVTKDTQTEVGDALTEAVDGITKGIPNQPIRGDVNFRKIALDTQQSMAGIQFKITNKRTGESHVVSTDKNGIFDSTAFKHSKNTNGGGMTDGVWFGEEDDIDDNRGAFYYGDYTLEELPGENNKDYEMITVDFSIYQEGRTVDLARIDNTHKPAFETELLDKDEEHEALAAKGTRLTDTVYYSFCNKYVGQTFTAEGSLVNKETSEVIATQTVNAKIRGAEGSFDVKFNIDASSLEGKEVVAYQVISDEDGNVLATLTDPMNADETVRFPKIATIATDDKTGDHIAKAEESITINDTVNYEKLTPGKKYVMTGKLVDKATGEDLKDADGKVVTGEEEFTASESGSGSVVITFTFKANKDDYEGKSVVAFEQCKGADNDKVYAIHENPNDEDQTVHLPKVRTLADDDNTGIPVTLADENASVTDHVSYENLIPGKEYTLKGVLILKSTGAEAAKAEKTFTPSSASGVEDLTFTFDASSYENEDLVAMEELFLDDHSIAEHKDPEDPAQTIHVPEGRTHATDVKTGMQNSLAEKETIIADKVTYKNLLPGKTYRIKGTVMAQETGEEIPSVMVDKDGNEIEYYEFIARDKDGSEDIYLKYDSSALAGKDAVVFEDVTYNEKPVIVHHNLEDEPQTIHHPDGRTTAIDKKTGIKNTLAEEGAIVKDTFEYENLIPGNEYHVTGTVMDKETNAEIASVMVDEDGNPVENGYFVLNPEEKDGSIELYFLIDASALENHDAVCFERVTINGAPVIIHEDINDEEQTTHIPEGRTTARDSETNVQLSLADDSVTTIDTFKYKNLIPGTEYTVTGRVMNKKTGEEIPSKITNAEGEAEKLSFDEEKVTFTPSEKDGELEISFTYSGTDLAGEDAVVFERAFHNDVPVIIHENIDDESQTIHIPDGRTTAVSQDNGSHSVKAEEKTIIKDTFAYENLLPGKEYSITGRLMDKETEEEVKSQMVDADGKAIEKFTFTADKKDGSVVLYFEVNTSDLKGKALVTYEKVQFEDKDIIIHEDIEDEDQTVYVPDGYTTALDSETNDHIGCADEKVTINDEFFYENLVIGQTYTIKGVLMDKATKEAVLDGGKEVTGETTFTADKKDGSVVISITCSGEAVKGKTTVAFETVYVNGRELMIHADINDDEQTVHYPDGYTTALDAKTGTHNSNAEKEVTVKDEVFYEKLIPGKEYEVKGVLMDKSTKKPLIADGKEVTATKKFTPKESDGSIVLEFSFDGSALEGTTTVAFETVYYNGKEVFVHKDLTDEDQTIHFPEVKTTATDKKDGDHKLASSGTVTIGDHVVYKNLVPGKTYKVYGRLMSKATGAEATVDGKILTAESKPFTPDKADGSIDIELKVNASDLKSGDYVMFEKLYEILTDEGGKEVLIGRHEDLNDKSQTVTVPAKPKKSGGGHGGRVQTGEIPVMPIAGAGAVAALAAGAYLLKTRKKEEQE